MSKMKKKVFLFIALVILNVIQAAVFMLINGVHYASYSLTQRLQVLLHAVPQSLSVCAWVMAPVFLAGVIYVWIRGDWHRHFVVRYLTLCNVVLTTLIITNWVLYGFWGFPLDNTPSMYLADNPVEALKEVTWWNFPLLALLLLIVGVISHAVLSLVFPKRRSGSINRMSSGVAQQREGITALLLTVVMIVVGQGCFGLISISSSYFTDCEALNHAATHPVYSMCHAMRQSREPLSQQYRFMSETERRHAMSALHADAQVPDTVLLRPGKPNIILLLFESFTGTACHYLYPEADAQLMPHFDQAMAEGLAFTRCYANSFRTERGVMSVLASMPGQPTYSLMNDTVRCRSLHYLTHPLAEAGYDLRFIHGGDGTYCGLPSFLRSAGIEQQTDRRAFPAEQHDGPWGMQDGFMFDYLLQQVKAEAAAAADTLAEYPARPYFIFMPTISSHEPFEVPSARYADPYLNSVAYTDSCLGVFLDALRADTLLWRNLLVIGLPDHCYANYPEGVEQHEMRRFHIPMFWTGGAVTGHQDVTTLCQQTDVAATLLHQLGLETADMPFSHDIFAARDAHFAFYAWPDGFGFITDTCRYIQDNHYDHHPLVGSDDPTGHAEHLGKAYLQTLYDVIGQAGPAR